MAARAYPQLALLENKPIDTTGFPGKPGWPANQCISPEQAPMYEKNLQGLLRITNTEEKKEGKNDGCPYHPTLR